MLADLCAVTESMEIILTLGVLVLALVCFVAEWVPADITAIGVTVLLMLLGLVTPEEGISGFSNSATITVLAMFILSAGIARTGVMQLISDLFLKWGGKQLSRQIIAMGLIVGPITAVINNTAVVSVFLPIVEDWCRQQKISVSKMLMPLSYVTVLGGMITLLGTSTNILASGLADKLGYGAFNIFDFTALGLCTFAIGLIYISLAATFFLPARKVPSQDGLSQDYDLRDYVTEVMITPRSNLVGQTLRSSQIQRKFDLDVLELIRNGNHFAQPLADKPLFAGDILIVRSGRDELLKIRDQQGLEIVPDVKFGGKSLAADLSSDQEGLAEVLVMGNSNLIGSTLKDLRFRQRYNATVLAIRRGEELVRERLGKVPLRFGDLLLVQGPKQSFVGLQTSRDLLVIEQRDLENLRADKAPIAIAIGLGVVLLAAVNILPILVSALLGVVLMVMTDCLKPGELYEAVRWDVIFLLAGLIPLGIAMENSGTTEWLATRLVSLGGGLPGYWMLTICFVITALLTEILSNNASVVLMLPIAARVAQALNLNPFVFMIVVTFAASLSFMTPIGYQTNTMIYGPGGYRFLDFTRFGAPLSLIMAIVIPPLAIWFYGI